LNPKLTIRGIDCFAHHWNVDPTKRPKALVVIFHGYLAHGNYPTVRYAAEFLSNDGFAVVAVDLPGHGRSEGIRGFLQSADTVISDGIQIVDYARNLYRDQPNLKLLLVGSSLGGAIALAIAHRLNKDDAAAAVAGVVLLAPMLKLNVGSVEHAALQFLAFILPTVPLIPSSATDDAKQYRDESKRQECAEDALTISGSKLLPASALACVDLTLHNQENFSSINSPFLLLIADEDVVIKNEGSEELFAKSPSLDKTKKNYPALHGLLCEPSPLFDEIKQDILQWMNAHI